jgi:2,3,4,5-tetrahydropyridine-2-carboxylate N-succinyltransferase
MGKKSGCNVLPYSKMETWEAGIFEYHDKMLLKKTMLKKSSCGSSASARYGSLFQVVLL